MEKFCKTIEKILSPRIEYRGGGEYYGRYHHRSTQYIYCGSITLRSLSHEERIKEFNKSLIALSKKPFFKSF